MWETLEHRCGVPKPAILYVDVPKHRKPNTTSHDAKPTSDVNKNFGFYP